MRFAKIVVPTLLVVSTAGCFAPLQVKHVDPARFYSDQTRNVLSSNDVSDLTRITLRRHDLLDRYEKQPAEAIAALHESLVDGTGGSYEIFSLAELSYYRGEKEHSKPDYLASALYAYAVVFPDNPEEQPNPLDPRIRAACDIYEQALAKAFANGKGDGVTPRGGTFPVPFGEVAISFDPENLMWHHYKLIEFDPVGELEVVGMRNIYRRPGFGSPLSAQPEPLDGKYNEDELIGPNLRVPVTMILRLTNPRQQLRSHSLQATLEVRSTTEEESIQIGGRVVPLEAEPTVVLASALVASRPWEQELGAFLGNAIKLNRRAIYLRAAQPYVRGKIPVVFVHGTASSVFRWADMYNDLQSDSEIRKHFQFWFYTYDSGNPILYSAYRLRKMLTEQVARLDPEGTDPALKQMVVIGHSQGGLLTKMTAIDSGDLFWRNASSKPFDEVKVSSKNRDMLEQAFFVKPLPFVKRLIFISTPHRGSYLAGPQIIRRLVQRLVSIPADILSISAEITGVSGSTDNKMSMQAIPTSIDNMSPGHPFIKTLSSIPIDPGVEAHSIIAVQQKTDIENGDDGVVKYQSAHIDGVKSELVVTDQHSCQANPHTVQEVHRILRLHLAGQPR